MKKFILMVLAFGAVSAYNPRPWYDPAFEPVIYESVGYQGGKHVDCVSLDFAFQGAFLDWARLQMDLDFSKTRKRSFSYEAFEVGADYRWMNDIVGDPISLVTGAVAIFPTGRATFDQSIYRPGNYEGEFFVSVGKEFSVETEWCQRFWGLAAFGVANKGAPWLRTELAYGINKGSCGSFEFYLSTLRGFGGNNYNPSCFHGWGRVALTSVDFGLFYERPITDAVLGLDLSYRIWERNYTKNVLSVVLNIHCAF